MEFNNGQWLPFLEDEDEGEMPRNRDALLANISRLCQFVSASPLDPPIGTRVIKSLIRIHMTLPMDDERISFKAWVNLVSIWRKKLEELSSDTRSALEIDVISMVHQMLERSKVLESTKIKTIGNVLVYLLAPLESNKTNGDLTSIVNFTKLLSTFRTPDTFDRLELQALRCDIVAGVINCPFKDDNELMTEIVAESSKMLVTELTEHDIYINCRKCLFKAYFFQALFLRTIDHGSNYGELWGHKIMEDDYFQEQFIQLLRYFVILDVLSERYGISPFHDMIKMTTIELKIFLHRITLEMPPYIQRNILMAILDRAHYTGYYWAFAKAYFEKEIDYFEESDSSLFNQMSKHDSSSTLNLPELSDNLEDDYSSDEDYIPEMEPKELALEHGFHKLQAQLKWNDFDDELYVRFIAVLRSLKEAHGSENDFDMLLKEATECSIDCTPDFLVNAYERNKDIIITDRNLVHVPWAQIVTNAALADYLSEFVLNRGRELSIEHWKFLTTFLKSITNAIRRSTEKWACTKVALVLRATTKLFSAAHGFAQDLQYELRDYPTFIDLADYIRTWNDKHAPIIINQIINICYPVLRSEYCVFTPGHMSTLGSLLDVVPHLRLDEIPPKQTRTTPIDILSDKLINALAGRRHPAVQLLAFNMLRQLKSPLLIDDNIRYLQWIARYGDDEDNSPTFPLLSVMLYQTAMHDLQNRVYAVLSNIRLCEDTFEVNHSIYTPILGYLMLSIALFEQCEMVRGDLVQHYIQHFRINEYAACWMRLSMRLLPRELIQYAADLEDRLFKPLGYEEYFTKTIEIDNVEDAGLPWNVKALACRLLYCALGGLGLAEARSWWLTIPRAKVLMIRKLVEGFISDPLQRSQYEELSRSTASLANCEVRIKYSTSEAFCYIKTSNNFIKLCIKFSDGHPLILPTCRYTCSNRFMAPSTAWLMPYFNRQAQNGCLFNAFEMWNRATNAYSETEPKCFKCMCTRHIVSGKLPSLICHRCLNKFHENCLVPATCPICY